MSSTFVLITLLLSLSMAVLVPEIKDSKNSIFSFSPEYDHMVNKQRKGFLTIGLLAVSTFFYIYPNFISTYIRFTSSARYALWGLCIHFFSSQEGHFA